jgi:hypothetical protein
MRTAVLLMGALCLSACGDNDAAVETSDPSQLSAELEAEAKGIEDRANAAARAAERLAERELEELRAEAARVDASQSTDETLGAPEDDSGEEEQQ